MAKEKQVIRSLRKGSAQWNEEDRLQIANLLVKAGYAVRINRQIDPAKPKTYEYIVEFWDEGGNV